MILDVGAGPASQADIQIDKVKFPKTTIVQDAMMERWKIDDASVDEVRMEQFLEHCPSSVHERVGDSWIVYYPRIHCMKEAYRVLKPGGILHASVPCTLDAQFQDPTHEAGMITEGWFNYFCGEWGGNEPGSFAYESYGINFKFRKITAYKTGFVLTVRLQKDK
jgi:predicted SAM-dependent methyltransferase